MPRRWIAATKEARDLPTPTSTVRAAARKREHPAVDGISAALLQLQRSVGNEVVLRLLAGSIQREPGGSATGVALGEPDPASPGGPSPDTGQTWQARGPWYMSRDQTRIDIGARGRAVPGGPSPDTGRKWQARGPWYANRDQTRIDIGARGPASPVGSPSDSDASWQNLRPGLAFDQDPSGDAGQPPMAKGAFAPKSNKVAVSYANLRSRDAQYQNEFTEGNEGLKNVYKTALLRVQEGLYPNVATYMQQNYGWPAADTAKYFDKIPNLGTTTTDKPVVAAVAPQDRTNYALSGGKTLIRGGAGVKYDTSGSYSKFRGIGFGIFVMGADGQIYAGDHRIGLFHHSSLLAGGAVAGAGELKVIGGALKWITNKSGHYTPTAAQSIQVLAELQRRGVDLASVDYTHLSAKSTANNFDPYPGKALAFYAKFKDQPEMADQ